MKNVCKTLANLELVLGIIGSGLLANIFGQHLNFVTQKVERDGTRTAVIFLSTLFGVVIIWALLSAASNILENQERIIDVMKHIEPVKKAEAKESMPLCGVPNEYANTSGNTSQKIVTPSSQTKEASDETKKDDWMEYDTWKCPNCKRINDKSVTICSCGTERNPQNG